MAKLFDYTDKSRSLHLFKKSAVSYVDNECTDQEKY